MHNCLQLLSTGRGRRKVLSLYSTYQPSPKKVSLTPLKNKLKGIVDSDSESEDDRKSTIIRRKNVRKSSEDGRENSDDKSGSEKDEEGSGKENVKRSKRIIDSDSD